MADVLTTWSLPAETKEFVPITVTANGDPVTAFEVAMTAGSARPTVWASADVVSTEKGILLGAGTSRTLVVGTKYTLWVRFTDAPEVPVQRAGYVKAT